MLIDLKGVENSNFIISVVGILFVLPFLLFSPSAGVLADTFSKQKVIFWLKLLEVVIIFFSFFAYYYHMVFFCYFLVFALSTQSALITPSKYSIIPELVRRENIPRASGEMTASIYMAIVVGTFVAAFITQITGRNFVCGLVICLFVSILGCLAAALIPGKSTGAKGFNNQFFFLGQIWQTLKICKTTPRLLLVIVGSAYFMFIGGFIQLNMIPFAMECLHLSEIGGGYLFILVSIGIALGCKCAGSLCKKSIELGLSVLCLVTVSILVFCLALSSEVITTSIALFVLGIVGGLYVVPLESYIQCFSPTSIRGKMVATENFLSFLGVLMAPICIFLFDMFGISPKGGFVVLSLIIFVTCFVFVLHLSGPFFKFLSNTFLSPFCKISFINYPYKNTQENRVLLLCKKKSLTVISLLMGDSEHVHTFYVKEKVSLFDKFFNKFLSITILYKDIKPEDIYNNLQDPKLVAKPIIFFESTELLQKLYMSGFFKVLESKFRYNIVTYNHKWLPFAGSKWKVWGRLILCFSSFTRHKCNSNLPAETLG